MPLNLPRIAAALNAYPWTPGHLTKRGRTAPTYCAIGALLRYAGVAQEHIACVSNSPVGSFWTLYGPLLHSEYGIPDERTAWRVIEANDSADSQAEAIERVLGVLAGDRDPLERPPSHEWEPGSEPDDDAGSLVLAL
jgi:hypothetical protein